MAVFNDPWADPKIDWQILQNGPIALYHSRDLLAKDLAWFEDEHYKTVALHCGRWRSGCRFHADVKKALDFPNYYGKNLNAFNDCMSDLEIAETGGLVVVLWEFADWFKNDAEFATTVIDILAVNARHHLLFGERLIILLQSDDPALRVPDVGATPVLWAREPLDKDRGL
ncbi:MAG: barstar family protein [Candidatus Sumerlaeia bacterium]